MKKSVSYMTALVATLAFNASCSQKDVTPAAVKDAPKPETAVAVKDTVTPAKADTTMVDMIAHDSIQTAMADEIIAFKKDSIVQADKERKQDSVQRAIVNQLIKN